MSDEPVLRTLQLVTTRRPFFEQQVRVLERNGVACTVLTVPGGAGARSVADYVRFHARTLRTAVGGEFDLVHANYGLTAPSALAQPRRPLVLSLWGSDLFGTYRRVSQTCAGRFDAVVVMSEGMADELDHPARVIPHGVDTETFAPRPRAKARAELGWDPEAKHVLFPYDPSRAVKDYPRAESVVEAADDAIDATVTLHAVHGVAHDRVPTYMNAADAMLLTSRHEGSPNAVKEALACTLPVVAVDVGDVAGLLDGLRNCHVCRSDDELVDGLLDALESGGRSDGRERIERIGQRRMARDLLAVYDDVL